MKFYFYLLSIIYSASLFGACPAMNYKFSVNEDKFKKLSDARKYMTKLQKEAKKEGRKLEVIKVDRYNYKVISEKDAEEEYSQLSSSAK